MGKHEFKCTTCGNKITLETDKTGGQLTKVKGAAWRPLLTKTSENLWIENSSLGVGLRCKCATFHYSYNFTSEADSIEVLQSPKDDQLLVGFCQKCQKAVIDHSMKCPTCGGGL